MKPVPVTSARPHFANLMKFFASIFLVLLCANTMFAQGNAQSIRRHLIDDDSRVVLVAAHRAPHTQYPENSLAAIREGIRMGVDILELDVKVSKDGVPFLMHDHTLDRTTTGKGEAEAWSWDELQTFFLKKGDSITGQRIPSLQEALLLAKDDVMIDLDMKTDKVEDVIRIVEETGASQSVIFFDSDTTVLKRVQEAGEFLVMPRARSHEGAQTLIARFSPEVVHIDPSFYSASTCRMIDSQGARIWINALGDADSMLRKGKTRKIIRRLTRYGANVIQTDEPSRLIIALQQRGLR